ncbi:MAG: shikimate kinase [Chitinophagales bacterium]|nr:shikimate kinase [Bacteroidota bacterium]MCB9044235.1 shikimate kinase [Chitinophagales bacterium]
MSNSRIFLVGFMGAGKTTVGKQLAKRIGYEFIDLDDYIESKLGKSIKSLVKQYGETKFRALESDALKDMKLFEKVVISTGGGTPCFFDNMHWINQHGWSIYLELPSDILYGRLKNQKDSRPLIADLDKDELQLFLEDTLTKRIPFYEQAELTIPQNQRNARELAIVIAERFHEYTENQETTV